jgi:hypothetical protein
VNELGVGHLFYQLYVPDPEFIHTFYDRTGYRNLQTLGEAVIDVMLLARENVRFY